MEEIAPGVRRWHVFHEKLGYRLNGHVWGAGRELVVVDPPLSTPGALAFFAATAGRRATIVVTNHTHWRDTSALRERLSATVAMSAADAGRVPGPVDRVLEPGEDLPGGWLVVDMAGKTIGEIGLYRATGAGALILGDTLIGDPPGELRLLPEAKIEDLDALSTSLRRAAGLDFDALLVGDGEPIVGGADRAVRALLERLT